MREMCELEAYIVANDEESQAGEVAAPPGTFGRTNPLDNIAGGAE